MYYVRFKEWWGLRSWKLSVTGMNQIWAEGKAKKLLSPFTPSLLQLFLPLMSEVREQVKWKSDWEVVHVTLSYCFKNIYFYLCLFFFYLYIGPWLVSWDYWIYFPISSSVFSPAQDPGLQKPAGSAAPWVPATGPTAIYLSPGPSQTCASFLW